MYDIYVLLKDRSLSVQHYINHWRLNKKMMSVFHLPKNSGNSGRVVNGTRLFVWFVPLEIFQSKRNSWKGSPVFPVEISQRKICVPFTELLSYHQFHAFRGLLSGLPSLEWDLWQMERAFLERKFPMENFRIFL